LKAAEAVGVEIEYVETNSSWYKDHEQAKGVLRGLMDNGVSTLLVSISPFHNEYIPFAKLKGVVAACHSAGMNLFPWIIDFYEEIDRLDDAKPHSLDEYAELFGKGYVDSLLSRYRLTRKGRALKTFARLMPRRPLAEILAASAPCRELDDAYHFHVDVHGTTYRASARAVHSRRGPRGRPFSGEVSASAVSSGEWRGGAFRNRSGPRFRPEARRLRLQVRTLRRGEGFSG
jgi:hypothetical protein